MLDTERGRVGNQYQVRVGQAIPIRNDMQKVHHNYKRTPATQ